MSDPTPILVAGVALIGSLTGAWLSFRASSTANRINDKRVDAEAYQRAVGVFEKALAAAETELERAQSQIKHLRVELTAATQELERHRLVGAEFRQYVADLEDQVDDLERIITDLRRGTAVGRAEMEHAIEEG